MIWKVRLEDRYPLLLIMLLPLIFAAPLLLGFLNSNPALYIAQMTIGGHGLPVHGGGLFTGGLPTIEGNDGITTQSLGYLSALNLVHGRMPWWNAYTGVGVPLAAQYQPASFFPPTLLLLLPQGMLWEHLLLQVLAGWGAYALLRQLGLGRWAALTGGVLFAFNGTLAWYDSAGALPMPLLPWTLLGVERAWIKAETGLRGGWRLFALSIGLSLLGGFPEEAYLNGLLALTWAGLRLFQAQPDKRLGFIWRITLGGVVGIALAGPQILAFFESLPVSFLWLHGSHYLATTKLAPLGDVPSLVAPYVLGPIYQYKEIWPATLLAWGGLGGYVTATIVVAAAYGLVARRSLLGLLLLGWVLLAVGRMLGLEPATFVWNHVPGAADTAVPRYIQPSWSLALVILAAYGVDDLIRVGERRRAALLSAGLAALAVAAAIVLFGIHFWPILHAAPGLRIWAYGSLAWAALTTIACLILMAHARQRWAGRALAFLLMGESAVMFVVPTLSNAPGGTKLDLPAVEFLRQNLGLNRFYTLGPIQPNYGSYFGIASINHNNVPDPTIWVEWDKKHLGRSADEMFWPSSRSPGQLSHEEGLRQNLPAFEWTGVKYVVVKRGNGTPFAGDISAKVGDGDKLYLAMNPGQGISGKLPANTANDINAIAAVGVSLHNTGGATGALKVTVCSGRDCRRGSSSVAAIHNDAMVYIPLNSPLPIHAGSGVRYEFTYDGRSPGLALRAYPVLDQKLAQDLVRSSGPVPGRGLQVQLRGLSTEKIVYSDSVMDIYELPNPSPYFEAVSGSCKVEAHSRTDAAVDCAEPSTLLRRELFYPGWTAQVNGIPATISEYNDIFQTIALPRGRSLVSFRYAPPHVIWMWMLFWVALIWLVGSTILDYRARFSIRRDRRSNSESDS